MSGWAPIHRIADASPHMPGYFDGPESASPIELPGAVDGEMQMPAVVGETWGKDGIRIWNLQSQITVW